MNEKHAQKLLVAMTLIEEVLEDMSPRDSGCPHPPNRREDLRGFGSGPEHWRCLDCGYEYKAEADEVSSDEDGGGTDVPG